VARISEISFVSEYNFVFFDALIICLNFVTFSHRTMETDNQSCHFIRHTQRCMQHRWLICRPLVAVSHLIIKNNNMEVYLIVYVNVYCLCFRTLLINPNLPPYPTHTQRKSCLQRLSLDSSTITVTWQQLVRLQTTSNIDLCLFLCWRAWVFMQWMGDY